MLDVLLLLMVTIWGSNFSLIKVALRDFPELPFNGLRLLIAAALLGALVWLDARRRRAAGRPAVPAFTATEWRRIVLLAIVGHLVYQLCFLAGVARTSVANSSLIFGCTPVMVAFLSSLAGHERIRGAQWAGAALSLTGLYVLVGHRAAVGTSTLAGDLLMFVAMTCWSLYSVLARPLLARHAPLAVTAWSMGLGAVLYGVAATPAARATDWAAISALSWLLMVISAVFAIAVAFLIWYTGVQRIGSSRTAIYSNLTPIVAMIVAAIWIGEPITTTQVGGATAILAGVVVTRRAPRDA
ncbi:MAG: DMT family transporter [Vicinamibacterales bacterium]